MFSPDFSLTKELLKKSGDASKEDIKKTLGRRNIGLEEFGLLISPKVDKHLLKELAVKSHALTRKRFGYALSLYVPLYYSNKCTNGCTYCGFNAVNSMERRSLSIDEIEMEAGELRGQKFKNILLVAGEHPESSDTTFLVHALNRLHSAGFSNVSIEIAPLDTREYEKLVKKGHLDGLYIYQETYNRELFNRVHPFGKKSDYDYRIATPERGAKAGVGKIGIGFLLGLNDWREDALNLAQHLLYLQKHHWQPEYSISFPRIRNAEGIGSGFHEVSDMDFINLVTALRMLFPETGMSLSTREYADFRDKIIPLGFTNLSAGSSTAPGGYTKKMKDLEQFEVEDNRAPENVAQILKNKGFDPIWKDWE